MPAPTEWRLSLASMTAIGMPGLLWVAADRQLPTHKNPAFGKRHLLANLVRPFGMSQRRRDKLSADITLAQSFLVRGGHDGADYPRLPQILVRSVS
jgi:hypothetical protein